MVPGPSQRASIIPKVELFILGCAISIAEGRQAIKITILFMCLCIYNRLLRKYFFHKPERNGQQMIQLPMNKNQRRQWQKKLA
jgi:hypothetical protein